MFKDEIIFPIKYPSGKEWAVQPLAQHSFSHSVFPEYIKFIPHQNVILFSVGNCRNDTSNNKVSVPPLVVGVPMNPANMYVGLESGNLFWKLSIYLLLLHF